MALGFQLGIDFGTSNTVAMLRSSDGISRPLLFDGSPQLVSAVFADPGGDLLVGRDAVHSARVAPERFEPNPKRLVDDGTVLLGDREMPVAEVIGAVLRRVADEAGRVAGGRLDAVTMTYPVAWQETRRSVLLGAAELAGLSPVTLVPEPVAAARYLTRLGAEPVPDGRSILVYDLGGGTFDASVVRRTAAGYAVVTTEGLADMGGLDIDAALVAYFAAVFGTAEPARWRRVDQPSTSADRRLRVQLWDDVRTAKEMLSRTGSTFLYLAALDQDAPLGREQLNAIVRPLLERTVAACRAALTAAGVKQRDLHAIFLVGAASRMPLVATLLHRAFEVAPTVVEQPELVVAEGSLLPGEGVPPAGELTAPPHVPSVPGSRNDPVATAAPRATETPAPAARAVTVGRGPAAPRQAATRPVAAASRSGPAQHAPVTPEDRRTRPVARPPGWDDAPELWRSPMPHSVELILPDVGPALIVRSYLEPGTGQLTDDANFTVRDGRLLAARTPAQLAAFLHTDRGHEMARIPDWTQLTRSVTAELLTPDRDDSYELDLVTAALRGDPMGWEPQLLVSALQIAQQLDYALDLPSAALLEPDSFLNRFDDALRTADAAWLRQRAMSRLVSFDPVRLRREWTQVIGDIVAAIDWVGAEDSHHG